MMKAATGVGATHRRGGGGDSRRADQLNQDARTHIPLSATDARHAADNVSRWNAYLPTECVRTMVRMGWDYST